MIARNTDIQDVGRVLNAYMGTPVGRESYGGYDLTDYSKELAKSGLSITDVRVGTFNENINGRNVSHEVLIVSSRNIDQTNGEMTGVRDFLEHTPGNNSRSYSARDVVNRQIVNTNGVDIYGG